MELKEVLTVTVPILRATFTLFVHLDSGDFYFKTLGTVGPYLAGEIVKCSINEPDPDGNYWYTKELVRYWVNLYKEYGRGA